MTALLQEHARTDKLCLEFLRKSALSLGIYRLPAGGADPQSPHTEDEVYYVVEGRTQIRVGDEDRSVGPGSIVFVAARVFVIGCILRLHFIPLRMRITKHAFSSHRVSQWC